MNVDLVATLKYLREPHPEIDLDAYESPLEYVFAHHATKYFRPGYWLETQVPAGRFRLDLVFARVGFECDGWAFHTTDEARARDAARDRHILSLGMVDTIYRIPGRCLVYRPEDCFYAISWWDTHLFSQRGLRNLEHLASRELRQFGASHRLRPAGLLKCNYARASDDADPPTIERFEIERRVRVAE